MFDPQTLTAISLRRAAAHLTIGRLVAYGALVALGFVAAAALFDEPVMRAVRNWPGYERTFFLWLTDFGKSDWILIPTAVAFLAASVALMLDMSRAWRWAWRGVSLASGYLFLAVAIPGLTAVVIKRLIGRARPYVAESTPLDFQPFQLIDYTMHSFPSGHATTAIAMSIALFTLTNGRFRGAVLIIGLLIGLSRVVVGDHYLTDVLAGLVVGTATGLAVRDLFATRRWGMRVVSGRAMSRIHVMFWPLARRLRRQRRSK